MTDFTSVNIRTWSRLGSCGAFGVAALELPEINDKSVVLTADLCTFSGLDRFKAKYPDRLYNVGIAEQNMVGIAAGMAKEGFVPFATTYATFASMRCADQIKVSMGYMKLPVKLVGMTAGYSVGILGATHIALEDIAVMRSIPNVAILSPADCTATIKAVYAAAGTDTPVYLRLSGTMNNPVVYKEDFDFEIGKAITLREGTDIAVIATGTMVYNSLQAAEKLAENGLSVKVVDMHTIKPLDVKAVKETCSTKLIVTVEEHSVYGGLGGAVAEALALERNKPPHLIIGVSGDYPHAASYPYLLEQAGLTADQIALKIQKTYEELCK